MIQWFCPVCNAVSPSLSWFSWAQCTHQLYLCDYAGGDREVQLALPFMEQYIK
jgi:hypothetical protein